MPDSADPLFAQPRRSNWVRLRTLIILRWVAIAGQLSAVVIGSEILELRLQLGGVLAVIGALVISNLVAGFIYPENKRLSEGEMTGLLMFDITQLALLLALTGGLSNPFALLVLAPVAISATALTLRPTLLIGGTAILLITAAAIWHLPLRLEDGSVMVLPDLFRFGFWMAIMIGVVFQAAYAQQITNEVTDMGDALLAMQMALAREQKLTDLGGVIAAAAHELGTPLATIALVSGELRDELQDSDHRDDAALIREQANRCRDILRSMGGAGKDDPHMQHAPFVSVIEEAAEPHRNRGKDILMTLPDGADGAAQPVIPRRPEIIHGIRNLVQNAVDFATAEVRIELRWSEEVIALRISDDGPGYSPDVLPRIGDPFMRRRRPPGLPRRRPDYDGMGLGLFIAKTLLERSGAELSFANGPDTAGATPPATGAVVEVVWSHAALVGDTAAANGAARR